MSGSVHTAAGKPQWLRGRIGSGPGLSRLRGILRNARLHTVCEEAFCPNMGTCWENGRATVMILGGICSRQCRFCKVEKGTAALPDPEEPARVAAAVNEMGLNDIVLTSVTRDDLEDGGAAAWAETIRRVRESSPTVTIEILVPDFGGSASVLAIVLDARPDVFGHNLETVASLYPTVRPQADYRRSLDVLRQAAERGLIVKTGIMLGLGERADEVTALMRDARAVGCHIMYMGQYLQPTKEHAAVERYVEPLEFDALRASALDMGFDVVVAGPLVRSSYHSVEQEQYVLRALRNGMPASRPVERGWLK